MVSCCECSQQGKELAHLYDPTPLVRAHTASRFSFNRPLELPHGSAMIPKTTHVACASVLSLCLSACGSDKSASGPVPWSDQRTQVVDEDRTFTEVRPVSGGACVEVEGVLCAKPAEKCGKEAADILINSKGEVLDYLCYPGPSTLTVDELSEEQGVIAQQDNDSVIVLDNLDDGIDVTGDVAIDANNVILYGESPDTAIIGGSLTLDGNNPFVRGVRIQGDVTVLKNNAVLAFCVIEGNLTITGNNTRLLGCDVLGSVTINGNNSQLYGNRITGRLSAGDKSDCEDNFSAADVNADLRIEPGEVGAALGC
jgi:hypothetical protein